MLTITVCDNDMLLQDGYRQLSVVPLAEGLQLGTEVVYEDRTYARVAVMTQLTDHFRCGFDEVEKYTCCGNDARRTSLHKGAVATKAPHQAPCACEYFRYVGQLT